MNNLPHSIELHDSVISDIESRDNSIVVQFPHAYIHNEGKGWSQAAEIEIKNAEISPEEVALPSSVSGGTFTTAQKIYGNLLELPLSCSGEVNLEITLTSGTTFTIKGKGAVVNLFGVPEFIENVSVT